MVVIAPESYLRLIYCFYLKILIFIVAFFKASFYSFSQETDEANACGYDPRTFVDCLEKWSCILLVAIKHGF